MAAEINYTPAQSNIPGQPLIDPLSTIGKVMGVQQGMLQNRLLGQDVAGKIAYGKAAQAAIDPSTGQFDPDAMMRGLAATPEGAQLAPQAATLAQQQRLSQIQQVTAAAEAKRQELGLTTEQGKLASAGFLPFIHNFSTPDPETGKVPVPTAEDVHDTISQILTAAGPAADENFVRRAASIQQQASQATDPKMLLQIAKNTAVIGNPSPEVLSAVFGSPDKTDTGPGVAITQTPGLGGPVAVRGVIDKGLNPSEENTPAYTTTDAQGVQHIVTKKAAAAAGNGTPAGITSGVGLGAEAAANSDADAQTKMVQGWRDAADAAPTTKGQLENLRNQVGKYTSGPQASWMYRLKALGTQFGIATPQVKDEVAAQEEFNKLSSQFINSQVSAIGGGGTDSKLVAAMHGSPNDLMSQQGVTGVLGLMEGLEDAKIAKANAWAKWQAAGHGTNTAGQFQSQWNSLFNPRVFQSQYMSDAQKATMFKGMSDPEKAKFTADAIAAKRRGWIQ